MYKKGAGNDKRGKDAGNRTLCPYRNFSQAIICIIFINTLYMVNSNDIGLQSSRLLLFPFVFKIRIMSAIFQSDKTLLFLPQIVKIVFQDGVIKLKCLFRSA